MSEKDKLLYKFYKQCMEKGYSDMQDVTESLKAKVIATDLGIKYKDIAKTYEEAKVLYEEERKRVEHLKVLQNVSGKFILSLMGNGSDEYISIYLREDGSFYCTIKDKTFKHEGVPTLNLKSGGVLLYTHHPSKAVFTGAASGGIAMGGIHHTQAYVDEKVSSTGNGYIDVEIDNYSFTLKKIEISDFIKKKFKRQEWLKANLSDGKYIYCYDLGGSDGKDFMVQTALKQGNFYDKMSMISMAADSERLSMDECKKRILFLNDVFTHNYPASDETVYLRALSMENADTSVKIRECIQVFEGISDYKDSKDRIKKLEAKYEEVLQYEKEQAILQKEAKEAARQESAKKAGKIIPIVIVAGIAAAVAFVVMGSKKQKESDYQTAVTYMEEQSYEGAVQLFSELKDYNDASELLDQCCNLWIEQANTYIEDANYEQALLCLGAIEDLPDALSVREDTKQKLSEVAEMIDDVEKMQNLQLAIEYYDVEYLMAWADRGEFKQLTGDEIREIIVGQWNAVHDSNRNEVVRYDYEADGTLLSLDGVSDGTVITYSYTVENDYFVYAGTERVVYDLGNGYYLICRDDSYVSGALYWRR